MTPASVSVAALDVSHRGQPAIRGLTGTFAAGALTAVIGPNGAGKSSLLAVLAGALAEFRGSVQRPPLPDIAYLPQLPALDAGVPASVHEVVAMGLWPRLGSFRALDATGRDRVAWALSMVGLRGLERRLVGELSVGQRQRMLFARVMLQDARLVLLDEPFSAVDPATTADLAAVLQRWRGEGRTVIVALHDLDLVRTQCDEALLLSRRAIAWGTAAAVLRPGNLAQAWRAAEVADGLRTTCEQAA